MTLNDFVRQGKVLYLGVSNFAAWQIMKALSITQQMHLAPISCVQPMYNLLKRQAESEILPMAINEGLGVFNYSPLGGGLLSGKYLKKSSRKAGSILVKCTRNDTRIRTNQEMVSAFTSFASENNYNPVSLAIAWTGAHPGITAPIIGARNVEQLTPALDSLKISMGSELRNSISALTLAPALATDREEERTPINLKLF